MSKEVRVLHIISGFGMGGAETWLLEMVKFAANNPQLEFPRMEFLCTSGKPAVLDKQIKANGGEIHYIALNRKSTFTFLRSFRKLLKTKKYVAIHDHQDFLSGWHFLFGFGNLPKVRIGHVHNAAYQIKSNYGVSIRRRFNQKVGRSFLDLFSTHVAGTSLEVLSAYGFDPRNQKHLAIHCSFHLDNFKINKEQCRKRLIEEFNVPSSHKIILVVGRLDKTLEETHPQSNKNSARAISIFGQLKDTKSILLIVGNDSGVKKKYENLIAEHGLSDRIILTGMREDIPKLMGGSDLLFFPSKAEGLGMVAVEAQACNLPVIASTAVPQECVVIKEFVNFEDLKKTNEEWAQKIDFILNQPKPRIEHDDLRWRSSPFNINNSMHNLKKIYLQE